MMTVWWSLWIATLLTLGMRYDISRLRSLGLLIYLLTLGKIVFVDLGRIFSSDGGLGVYIGIGIVMALGIVSIGLSMLYKRLMGEGMLGRDFLFKGNKVDNIMDELNALDISAIRSVSFTSP